ncbi:MAG: hypothetical protein LLG01_11560 [Planctomycetaceae bacterium]|nr:hypothetical protein [Planctomycetaceae bacterium]
MAGKQTKKRTTRCNATLLPARRAFSADTAGELNDLLATLHWQEQLVLYLLSRARKSKTV